ITLGLKNLAFAKTYGLSQVVLMGIWESLERSKGDTLLCCYCLFSHSVVLQMKILEGNAGALTNFEVLDFLRAKGASKDPTRVIAKVSQSEYKVYDYLVDTAASVQTRESINEFLTSVKQHDLAKAEVLNILNIGPAAEVELYPVSIKILIFPFILHPSIVRSY
ncbi:hypothetical protein D0Y65_036851, partial [Glycine soja]